MKKSVFAFVLVIIFISAYSWSFAQDNSFVDTITNATDYQTTELCPGGVCEMSVASETASGAANIDTASASEKIEVEIKTIAKLIEAIVKAILSAFNIQVDKPVAQSPSVKDGSSCGNCKEGEVCVDGKCVPKDKSCKEGECKPGEKCVDGKCVPADKSCENGKCKEGEKCVDGKCVPVDKNDDKKADATKENQVSNEVYTDFDKAKQMAKKLNRPIMMVFEGSDWCGYCKKFNKEIWHDPAFKDYASKNFVRFMADFPRYKKVDPKTERKNRVLMGKYGVRGVPAVIIVTPEGKVIQKTGYIAGGAKNYIRHIKSIMKQ